MTEKIQALNLEYGLHLTEEEMDQVAKQAEAAERLFQKLYEVDVTGVVPALRMDLADKP
jgi:Asp-tRNA(Asn)/Glu-tRNA(Gln) amidotransferase C subunit